MVIESLVDKGEKVNAGRWRWMGQDGGERGRVSERNRWRKVGRRRSDEMRVREVDGEGETVNPIC